MYDKIRYTQKGKRGNKVMSRTKQNRRSKRKESITTRSKRKAKKRYNYI